MVEILVVFFFMTGSPNPPAGSVIIGSWTECESVTIERGKVKPVIKRDPDYIWYFRKTETDNSSPLPMENHPLIKLNITFNGISTQREISSLNEKNGMRANMWLYSSPIKRSSPKRWKKRSATIPQTRSFSIRTVMKFRQNSKRTFAEPDPHSVIPGRFLLIGNLSCRSCRKSLLYHIIRV